MTTAPRHFLAIVFLASMSFLLPAIPAQAQLTTAEAKCRATVAGSMGKYVKLLQKSVLACHKKRDAGKIELTEDCNDPAVADTVSGGKVGTAADKAGAKISSICASTPSVLAQFGRCPAPHHLLDDGGATSGIDDFAELADCQVAHAGTLVQTLAAGALGLPDTELTPTEAACHGAVGKSMSRVVDTTIKERTKCQKALDSDGGPATFACSTLDPVGRIAAAETKGITVVGAACSDPVVPILDSCAGDAAGLLDCVFDGLVPPAGSGLTGILWELAGICPGSIEVAAGRYAVVPDVDIGAGGLVADVSPPEGHVLGKFDLSCDADCTNCMATDIYTPEEHCRCTGDESVQCAVDGDCIVPGGTCECFVSPPAHYVGGGYPVCVTLTLTEDISGSIEPSNGAVSLTLPSNFKIYTGLAVASPCPRCTTTCQGGDRDGLPCSQDARDPVFGATSFDCPPVEGANISGSGLSVQLELSTNSFSLPANLPCDPPNGDQVCACSTCSLDDTLACNSDAECTAAAAGVCRTDGLHAGVPRIANDCDDETCTPDPNGDDNEGVCLGSDPDTYCDALLTRHGDGVFPCGNNSDCEMALGVCSANPFADCGSCTISAERDCFLYPIQAEGVLFELLAGGACVPPTGSVLTDTILGAPGPSRFQLGMVIQGGFCPGEDESTVPYIFPGGVDCDD